MKNAPARAAGEHRRQGYRVSVAFEEGLGGEEIRIRTEKRLPSALGRPSRGVLYAVYQFLEDWMGVRWYSPELEVVPEKSCWRSQR